ncbi:MAG: cation transporter [Cyclobacteriaceae bacterium]|nr:cation transporter [Cyclobacteriaceae bacterium]
MFSKKGYKLTAIWISLSANFLLFIFKYIAGTKDGSIALIADAWHTLSDSVTSFIALIAVNLASKPADDEHPFGHGRAELIAALVIGVLLAMLGINFIREGIDRLIDHRIVEYSQLAIIVTISSIVVKELMAQFSFYAGRKTGSEVLRADGWHHRSDALSSIVVLAGIFTNHFFWWIDGVAGLIVSLMILNAARVVLKEAINPLLGERPDQNLIKKIKHICSKVSGTNIEPHHFHIHRYGMHTELTFHVRLDGDMSLSDAHELCKDIENKVREKLNVEATIHFDPL